MNASALARIWVACKSVVFDFFLGPRNIWRQPFININLHLHNLPYSPSIYFFPIKTTTFLVWGIHNNWHRPDTLNHFFKLCSFKGIVLLVILETPFAWWDLTPPGLISLILIIGCSCIQRSRWRKPLIDYKVASTKAKDSTQQSTFGLQLTHDKHTVNYYLAIDIKHSTAT